MALPDLNQVLKRMNGRLLPFGLWHFLRRKSIVTRCRVLLLGVLPEYRKRGLYPLLITELHRRAVRSRLYDAPSCRGRWRTTMLVNAGIEAAAADSHKTYRLYEKPVG